MTNLDRKKEAFALHVLSVTPQKFRKKAYEHMKWMIKNHELAKRIVEGYTPEAYRKNHSRSS